MSDLPPEGGTPNSAVRMLRCTFFGYRECNEETKEESAVLLVFFMLLMKTKETRLRPVGRAIAFLVRF